MFDVFFSETLTWQQQQQNVAAFVIMTTNLNWRPPAQEWDVILGNGDDHLLCT
jgi:hypothetical protein